MVPIAALTALAALWRGWAALPAIPPVEVMPVREAVSGEAAALPCVDWTIVQHRGDVQPAAASSDLARRFRLAGTFLIEPAGDGTATTRKAILDDFKQGTQVIVGENEQLDGARVVSVFRERVVVRDASGETELWLSFARHGTEGTPGGAGSAVEGERPLASYPYGVKRIGDRRWIFDRDSVLGYYKELMDNPERLVAVFDSLKPYRNESGAIAGYELDVQGEKDFFDTVGFRQGDIVRTVNSLPMTNRGRAEFFIREFVASNANAFAIEVERGGSLEKLIYHVR